MNIDCGTLTFDNTGYGCPKHIMCNCNRECKLSIPKLRACSFPIARSDLGTFTLSFGTCSGSDAINEALAIATLFYSVHAESIFRASASPVVVFYYELCMISGIGTDVLPGPRAKRRRTLPPLPSVRVLAEVRTIFVGG